MGRMGDVRARIPVVAGLAYIERLRRRPSSFEVTLVPEPENRYFRQAVAVMAGGDKLGYVAPEVALRYFEPITAATVAMVCSARRSAPIDRETSGVELFLDFSGMPDPA